MGDRHLVLGTTTESLERAQARAAQCRKSTRVASLCAFAHDADAALTCYGIAASDAEHKDRLLRWFRKRKIELHVREEQTADQEAYELYYAQLNADWKNGTESD